MEWPRGPWQSEGGTFVVTVLGTDRFGKALDDALRGKSVGTSPIVLRRATSLEDLGPSQIVFIGDSEKERLPAILKRLQSEPVLTVGDMDGFAARGGAIGFRLEGERIRLDVSLRAAARSELRISSQLLRLARLVDASQDR